jgi:hypothetical protein
MECTMLTMRRYRLPFCAATGVGLLVSSLIIPQNTFVESMLLV